MQVRHTRSPFSKHILGDVHAEQYKNEDAKAEAVVAISNCQREAIKQKKTK